MTAPNLRPCEVCALYSGEHPAYEVHPQADDLLESVLFELRHGKSPAQVIETLLGIYGEEPPEEPANLRDAALTLTYTLTPQAVDDLARVVRRGLVRLDRREGRRSSWPR